MNQAATGTRPRSRTRGKGRGGSARMIVDEKKWAVASTPTWRADVSRARAQT